MTKETESQRGEPSSGELRLTTNPGLDYIINALPAAQINLDTIAASAISNTPYFNPAWLTEGALFELYMKAALKYTIEKGKSERKISNTGEYLPDYIGINAENAYRFIRNKGLTQNIIPIDAGCRNVTDYDAFIDIDGLPTILSARISKMTILKDSKTYLGRLTALQKPEYISKIFAPLQAVYPGRNHFGYVIVTTGDIVQNLKSIEINNKFIKEGGVIIGMNMTSTDFYWRAKKIINSN